MKNLTIKQKLILSFIKKFKDENKYSPTFRDISCFFNMSSKGAYDHVKAIEKKGFISTTKDRARTITISDIQE